MKFAVNKRPYLNEFLTELKKHFEVIVFTAGTKNYAKQILKWIDPEHKKIDYLLTRKHCIPVIQNGKVIFVKDLRILNRRPANVVLVDNSAYSYAMQVDNGIPIV